MSEKSCSNCYDPEEDDNQILCCEKCGLQVHVLCYGIENTEKFICSPCNGGVENVQCALCEKSGGAMKKTTDNRWAHVICTFFTADAQFDDSFSMEPINITKVKPKKTQLACVFCNETAGTFTCCKRKCKMGLHAPCGHANNSLVEETTADDKISFLGYCNKHKPTAKKGRLSSEGLKTVIKIKTKKQIAQSKNENSMWILERLRQNASTVVASTSSDSAFGIDSNQRGEPSLCNDIEANENINIFADTNSCDESSHAGEEKTQPLTHEKNSIQNDDVTEAIVTIEPSSAESHECYKDAIIKKVSLFAMYFSQTFDFKNVI